MPSAMSSVHAAYEVSCRIRARIDRPISIGEALVLPLLLNSPQVATYGRCDRQRLHRRQHYGSPVFVRNSAVEYSIIVKQCIKLYSEKENDTNKDFTPIETIYPEINRIYDASLSLAGR